MNHCFACLSAIVCLGVPLCAATVDSLRGCDNGHSKLAEASYNGNWYWADRDAFPNAESDYVAKHAVRSLSSNNHNHVFGGHSLTLKAGGFWVKAYGTETFNGGGLFLEGGYFGNWGINATYTVKGTAVTVTAPTSAKFGFYPAGDISVVNSANARFVFDAPLVGAAGTGFYVSQNANPTIAEGYQWFNLVLKNDCSGYRGDIELRKGGILLYEGTAATFPASIVQQGGSTFSVNCAGVSSVSVASVMMNAGATLAATNAANKVTVGSLVYNGGTIRIALDPATGTAATLSASTFTMNAVALELEIVGAHAISTNLPASFQPVLKVPVASGLTTNDIRLAVSNYDAYGLPSFTLSQTDADGVRTFTLVARPIVVLLADDANNHSCLDQAGGQSGDAAHWSDSQYPHADADYLIPFGRTARTTRFINDDSRVTEFIGHSLVVAGAIAMKGALRASDIVMIKPNNNYNPTINSIGSITNHIFGGMITLAGTYAILSSFPYANDWTSGYGVVSNPGSWPRVLVPRYTYVDSKLRGSGQLSIRNADAAKDEPWQLPSYFEFTALNTNFVGKIALTSMLTDKNTTPTNEEATAVLAIRDARNLGGTLATKDAMSVSLTKNAAIWARDNVDVSDANRGFDIVGLARFIVDAEKELSVAGQITMRGTLRKFGDGTLALGGPVTYVTTGLTTPLAGTNVLDVMEGAIKPTSTNSFDGMAISFKAGTALKLDWPAKDVAVGTYGLYDVKWNPPFDLTDNGGMLDVAFDVADGYEPPSGVFSMPICTVSATAPSLEGCIRVAQPFHGRGVSILSKTVAAGTVTWYAEVQTKGTILVIR